MHVERLTELAEWLEAGAPHKGNVDGFNMNVFEANDVPGCGTVCCIAGAANQFFGNDGSRENDSFHADDYAAARLDLDKQIAEDLFFVNAYGESIDRCDITPAWAARTIRHLIATGEVDWEHTRKAKA